MENNNSTKTRRTNRIKPLVAIGIILSLMSLAWTTSSIFDLVQDGLIAITASAGADLIWGGILWAEWQKRTIIGRLWITHVLGWVFLIAVAGFLFWHGMSESNVALAVVGPILPIGTKIIWLFAMSAPYDPTAPTKEEQQQIDEILRTSHVEAAQAAARRKERQTQQEIEEEKISMEIRITRMQADLTKERLMASSEETIARLEAAFEVQLRRLRKMQELDLQRPLDNIAGQSYSQQALNSMTTPPEHLLNDTATPTEPIGAADRIRELIDMGYDQKEQIRAQLLADGIEPPSDTRIYTLLREKTKK